MTPSNTPPRSESPRQVCLGRIGGANGVRGAVNVQTYTDVPEDITAYGALNSEDGAQRYQLKIERRRKSGVIARIVGIDSREAAEALKGTLLFISRADLPDPTDEDEFYQADLVGMRAVDLDGAPLGEVIAVNNYGAGDVLELKPVSGGNSVLLPFNRDVVPHIDKAAAILRIDVPESLKEDLD
jgi:16S rRNA processing protein RimM